MRGFGGKVGGLGGGARQSAVRSQLRVGARVSFFKLRITGCVIDSWGEIFATFLGLAFGVKVGLGEWGRRRNFAVEKIHIER
jgi:hypothetical protein